MLPWERGPLRNVPGPAAWCLLPPGAAQPSLTIPSSFPTSATGGPLTDQTPHLKVMELSGFRVLTGLHNHHHNLILEHFHPLDQCRFHWQSPPAPLDLPAFHTNEAHNTVFGLLCLASFVQHHVSRFIRIVAGIRLRSFL